MGFVQKYYKVPGYSPDTITLGENLIGSGTTTSKISIMAPPGTTIQLQAKGGLLKNVLIGPSGIYDFDEEEIEIDKIIVPISGDYENEREKYQQILDSIKKDLKECIANIDGNNPNKANYQAFCSQFQSILKKSYSSDDDTITTTAVAAITHYLSIVEDFAAGNTNLSNVVINYITN